MKKKTNNEQRDNLVWINDVLASPSLCTHQSAKPKNSCWLGVSEVSDSQTKQKNTDANLR
jgi:hypothetical protein